MTISNKKLGNSFERQLCKLLYDKGFWVHAFVQSPHGQPADIIAVKNSKAYLIDCKVCSNGFFKISRLEANQLNSMTLWEECGNGKGLFAMLINDNIFILTKDECLSIIDSKKQINAKDLARYKSLEEWCESQ